MPSTGFRAIPDKLRARVAALESDAVEVGCVRAIPADELRRGALRHIGVELGASGLALPSDAVVPPREHGPWSRRNVDGYVIVRRDLPKERHYNYVEGPNWGDWARGSHTSAIPYLKYPRDYFAPRLATISATKVEASEDGSTYTIQFRTSDLLDRTSATFDRDLLEAVNFLRENVGCYGAQAHGASIEAYLQELRVAWELLPPGSKEQIASRLFRGRTPTPAEDAVVWDRYDFLMSLNPTKIVFGTSGMQRYFGGLFADERVVFENLRYGNAVYVMYENWKELSRRNRIELLSGKFGHNFVRVVHTEKWKDKVARALERRPVDPPPEKAKN